MKTKQKKNYLKHYLLPIVILVAAVLIFVALKKTKPESPPVEHQEKSWTVSAQVVKKGAISPMLTLYGRVDSLWSTTLTAGLTADVKEIHVIEGSRVARDGLLIVLDDSEATLELVQQQANVAEANARLQAQEIRHQADLENLPREQKLLQLARNEVARLSGLVKSKATSQSTLDTARQTVARQSIAITKLKLSVQEHKTRMLELQAQLQRAQAVLDKAQITLARTQIKAPYQAAVAKLFVAPGQRVRMGDKLIDVFDTEALVFRALLPDQYLPVINRAQAANDALLVKGVLDQQQVNARLLTLSSQVEQGSGGVAAVFKLSGTAIALQKGRLTKLQLTLPKQEAVISLPHEAMYGSNNLYRIDKDNRLHLLEVTRVGETLDATDQSLVLIRADALSDGDKLLTTQLPGAVDGLLVKVVQSND